MHWINLILQKQFECDHALQILGYLCNTYMLSEINQQPTSTTQLLSFSEFQGVVNTCPKNMQFSTCVRRVNCQKQSSLHTCRSGCDCLEGFFWEEIENKCVEEKECSCLHEGEVISPGGNFVVGDHDCVCFRGAVQCQYRSKNNENVGIFGRVVGRASRTKRATLAVGTQKCSKTCHDLHAQEAVCDPKGFCDEDHQLYDRNTETCVETASECSCNLPRNEKMNNATFIEPNQVYKQFNCVDYSAFRKFGSAPKFGHF